jgi:hypothetical protein
MRWLVTIALAAAVCACAGRSAPETPRRADPVDRACAWPAPPTVLARHDGATLQVWELRQTAVLARTAVPDDRSYLAFRAAIRAAGGDRVRPIADPPQPRSEQEREMWRREHRNVERVQSGRVGRIRPINCLEALVFAHLNSLRDQLTDPAECVVSILRKRTRDGMLLRVYFTAGKSGMFPPKQLYGFDRVAAARAQGWELWMVLHNHTVQKNRGRPALGEPGPSTSDVQLLRGLAADLGMREARVTNGLYTIEVDAAELSALETRE